MLIHFTHAYSTNQQSLFPHKANNFGEIRLDVNIRLIKSVLSERLINLCKWILFTTRQRKQPRRRNTIFTLFAQTHYQIIKV